MPGKVAEIEYDPNRTARIALVVYADGEKRYILHPKGLEQGDTVVSGPGADIRTGQRAAARRRSRWARRCTTSSSRSARAARWRARPARARRWWRRKASTSRCACRSTEMRLVHGRCLATIGEVGNAEHELLSIGKAGKTRWLGRRPKVRGVAMNPVDHPLGGGEGKTLGRPAAGVARGASRKA